MSMKRITWLSGLVAWIAPLMGHAVELYTDFPKEIHPSERYVFYSHGKIVEGTDEKPVSPKFGAYDFPAVRQALFEGGGYNLIAYHRPKDVDLAPSVSLLESWVRKLVAAGVKPSHITLVGFSRGGHITANAASQLGSLGINTAILAVCFKGDVPADAALKIRGPLLNIYETTDALGPCPKLVERSHPASFEEVAITTGKEHGAFYLPRAEWVKPLKDWIARTNPR
jgi:pimeloyl-ACP methyl ester carboxylesterase